MRSETWRTTARSWEMNRYETPVRSCSSVSRSSSARLAGHVERGGRLVADHQRHLPGEGPGDGHPLLLPAGELVRQLVEQFLRHPGARREFLDRLGAAEQLDRSGEHLADGTARVERRVRALEDDLDARQHLRAAPALVRSETWKLMRALVAGQPGQGQAKRRLAAAGLADEAEHLAAADRERDVPQRDRAVVALGQVRDCDQRLARYPADRRPGDGRRQPDRST